jgi:carboxymethylenebutenolidase
MTTEIARFMRELERIWDDHVAAALVRRDVGASMADMTAEPSVRHLPTKAGATGRAAMERFYAEELFPCLPADLAITRISRTVDRFRIADETTVSFTHDRELPWLLPGIAPTHRPAEIVAIAVVSFQRGKINTLRVLWDHATLTAQLGLSSQPTGAGPARPHDGRTDPGAASVAAS